MARDRACMQAGMRIAHPCGTSVKIVPNECRKLASRCAGWFSHLDTGPAQSRMRGCTGRRVAFIGHTLKLVMAARHAPLGMLSIRPCVPSSLRLTPSALAHSGGVSVAVRLLPARFTETSTQSLAYGLPQSIARLGKTLTRNAFPSPETQKTSKLCLGFPSLVGLSSDASVDFHAKNMFTCAF